MLIRKQTIIFVIRQIKLFLNREKYKELNESNNIQAYNIDDRMDGALRRLNNIPSDMFEIETKYHPDFILRRWLRFNKSFNGAINNDVKRDYGDLIKSTLRFLEYIRTIPDENTRSVAYHDTVRAIDVDDEKDKLERLSNRRKAIKEELERTENGTPQNGERIKELKSQLSQVEDEYLNIKRRISDATSDIKAEDVLSSRIEEAFGKLEQYTEGVERERKRANREYYIFLCAIPALIVLFVIFYCFFICKILSNEITIIDWIDYSPYALMVPVFIALLWLSTYMKNRANKISIELSTRLFNIHYLEGLLLLTNKLSYNQAEALRRINNAVDAMLHGYLRLIDKNDVSEKLLDDFENKELKDNPYYKAIETINDILKNVRQ